MRFRIPKQTIDYLNLRFKKGEDDFDVVELELVPETMAEALMKKNLEERAWHNGYHFGFKEGYYAAKNERPRPSYCEKECNF